jgi:hypothetical protein
VRSREQNAEGHAGAVQRFRAAARALRFEPGTLLKNQSEIYPGDHASEFQPPSGRARQFRGRPQ